MGRRMRQRAHGRARGGRLTYALVLAAGLAAHGALAPAAASQTAPLAAPSAAADAQVRLLPGDFADGVYRVVLRITLPQGALTYWRNPGDAGVAPTFDFSGSANLAHADVALPAPTRLKEAGGEAFGYHDEALFLITARPLRADAPLALELRFDYAVCARLCVPAHAALTLALTPAGGGDKALAARAAHALPRAVAAEAAATIAFAGAHWTVTPKRAARDLFVEAPEGFFAETRATDDGAFALRLVEKPKNARGLRPFRLTLTGDDGAVDFTANLDVGDAKP